ncbi:chromate transporter [Paenibacillus terrigena]|uniref:chromate transporter n=1 Tax=Paenibacillus terrigena TaxID=369333 RepID=UPI000476D1BA|nr:chromate transporter [Paenibacillus terrigena]
MRTTASKQLKIYTQIFWTFCRIGPSTFGGGYAMIPGIEREVVEKHGWMREEEMSDLVSIAGSAPGGVGVNLAAFIGYRLAGVMGAILAVAGIALPTFFIVFALSWGYSMFQDHPKIEAALKGIQGGVIALIIIAAYKMAKTALFDKTTAAVGISTVVMLMMTPIHPIYLIAIGLVIGLVAVQVKKHLGMQVYTEQRESKQQEPEPIYPEYYI